MICFLPVSQEVVGALRALRVPVVTTAVPDALVTLDSAGSAQLLPEAGVPVPILRDEVSTHVVVEPLFTRFHAP